MCRAHIRQNNTHHLSQGPSCEFRNLTGPPTRAPNNPSQALCFCPQLVHFVCESFRQFLVSWSSVQCPHLGGKVHALEVCPNRWHLKHWVTRYFESYGRTSWIIEPAAIPRARRVSERPSWGSFSIRDEWVFVVFGLDARASSSVFRQFVGRVCVCFRLGGVR